MKAIRTLLFTVALATVGTANAAVIATYNMTNEGNIGAYTTGTITETGTAVLEDIGNGQAIMTIDKAGITSTAAAGWAYLTSRIVYQGTLSDGVFSVVSGQRITLDCTPGTSTCCVALCIGEWRTLTETPASQSSLDGGGLPLTATYQAVTYDNLFHVSAATETMLTRIWSQGHTLSTINAMNFTNTTPNVPVPAAAWLFGTGLFGLASVARRRKAA